MNKKQQPQMNIDFDKTTSLECEECKNDTFTLVFRIRKLSALLSPTGTGALIPVQVYSCAKCGHINEEFKVKEKNDTV